MKGHSKTAPPPPLPQTTGRTTKLTLFLVKVKDNRHRKSSIRLYLTERCSKWNLPNGISFPPIGVPEHSNEHSTPTDEPDKQVLATDPNRQWLCNKVAFSLTNSESVPICLPSSRTASALPKLRPACLLLANIPTRHRIEPKTPTTRGDAQPCASNSPAWSLKVDTTRRCSIINVVSKNTTSPYSDSLGRQLPHCQDLRRQRPERLV
jgi:hypothetical protein